MVEEKIAEIGIDGNGKLFVRPDKRDFSYIYRAAMEIAWEPLRGVLLSPRPSELADIAVFDRILAAAADEYGVKLKIDTATAWLNVPEPLKAQIEARASKV